MPSTVTKRPTAAMAMFQGRERSQDPPRAAEAVTMSTATARKGRALAKGRNSAAPAKAPARAATPSAPGPAAAIQPRAKGAAPPSVCPAASAAERKKRTPRFTSRPARSRSNVSCPCATACPS